MTEQELEKLYREAYRSVYWSAISILKNKEDAEDVVQETFITAFEQYDTLKDKTKAVAWVKKIAANKSLNIVTRKRTINIGDDVIEETEDIGEDFIPDSVIESEEKRKIIMDIINNTLSGDVAMTIILFYFSELSTKEISERLNIPQGTVLSRINFAKKKIRKEVEKYEKDNDDKLFAGIPFLTMLFMKEAEQTAFNPMPSILAGLAASSKAAGTAAASAASKAAVSAASKTAAATASRASAAIVIRNVAIGLAAASAIGGAGFLGYNALSDKNEKTPKTSISTEYIEPAETTQKKKKDKVINVLGMTPDLLDLSGGYMRTGTYHDYHEDTDSEDHQYYYDSDDNLILECGYNEDGKVIYSDYFIYDDEGRVIREELWDTSANTLGLYKEYTYGDLGIERMDSGLFGKDPERYEVYEYDSLDRLIKITRYEVANKKTYWYCDYEYAEDGTYTTMVTAWDYLKWDMVASKGYCRYDADGKLLEEFEDFQNQHYVYTYDSNDRLTLVEHYYGSRLNDQTAYEYDSSGRLISRKTSGKDGRDWRGYTYEYKDI